MPEQDQDLSKYIDSKYQQQLWQKEYNAREDIFGLDEPIKHIPNQSALYFSKLMPANARILEIGCGNGRDARFWAAQGHFVTCVDFSLNALRQLTLLAKEKEFQTNLFPLVYDASRSLLPFVKKPVFDGFYARSSLHVDDTTMISLAKEIDASLKPGSHVLILGRTIGDRKIIRSVKLNNGLAVDLDESGHLRRIWTRDFIEEMCKITGWKLVEIANSSENMNNKTANYITMVAQKNG